MSAQTDDADVMAALTDCLQRLSNRSTSPVDTAGSSVVEPLVRAVYAQRDGRPLWQGSAGGVTADAAIQALHALDAHGLDPRDYASDSWGRLRESGDPASIAELDVTLTGAWLRAMVHAHRGRVDPRELGYAYSVPPKAADYPALLIRAVEGSRLTELIETLEPNLPQFRRLEAHLVRYRALASWSPPPLSAPATKVSPGDTFETTEPLSALLTALGDLPPDAAAERRLYSGALVDAVERFQERHGLDVDGALGKRTWRQLSTPLAARVRQIELSLERMRWLPAFAPGHVLIVNLPDFHVYGFDSVDNDRPEVQLDVVIGKAAGSRTPLFAETLRYLIVRPYWHVPRSIVEQEIIPELRRNPSYLERNALDAQAPLPAFYWDGDTEMSCLRDAIGQTLRLGYAHHIQRLMVTGLFALLLGVDPRRLHEWYLAVYVDAVEWVELPNTIGMSQYADGGLMASKPYVASGRYLQRMSNCCAGCRYDPARSTGASACPFTTLYWDFLRRHAATLRRNPRMVMQMKNLDRLDADAQAAIAAQAEALRRRHATASELRRG